jgi:hypothetical protein
VWEKRPRDPRRTRPRRLSLRRGGSSRAQAAARSPAGRAATPSGVSGLTASRPTIPSRPLRRAQPYQRTPSQAVVSSRRSRPSPGAGRYHGARQPGGGGYLPDERSRARGGENRRAGAYRCMDDFRDLEIRPTADRDAVTPRARSETGARDRRRGGSRPGNSGVADGRGRRVKWGAPPDHSPTEVIGRGRRGGEEGDAMGGGEGRGDRRRPATTIAPGRRIGATASFPTAGPGGPCGVSGVARGAPGGPQGQGSRRRARQGLADAAVWMASGQKPVGSGRPRGGGVKLST